jgi:hypothetical protein
MKSEEYWKILQAVINFDNMLNSTGKDRTLTRSEKRLKEIAPICRKELKKTAEERK